MVVIFVINEFHRNIKLIIFEETCLIHLLYTPLNDPFERNVVSIDLPKIHYFSNIFFNFISCQRKEF